MALAALKLINPVQEPDILRFERRQAIRRRAAGPVTTIRREPRFDHWAPRISTLNLRNVSDTGLGAYSAEQIELDSMITLRLGTAAGNFSEVDNDIHGRVVRCRPTAQGFEIGVHFDTRPAA